MNCSETRAYLPLLISGDLGPAQQEAIESHLKTCPSCRGERTALGQVCQLLDAAPAPGVEVDVPALYRRAAETQRQRLRRWRRATVALGAVAALLLLGLGLNLEVRVEAHQIVVRWGNPPPAPEPAPVPPVALPQLPPGTPDEEKVRILAQLVPTLAAEVQGLTAEAQERDYQVRQALAGLREELRALQRQNVQQWTATERDVAALYAAQFLTKKGNGP
jgi:anti-sigma factor RsiW